MNNFKIIELDDPIWRKYLDSSFRYDFHHTPSYHKIEKKMGDQVLLFVAEDNKDFIAFPLIIKEIPHSSHRDATSVYGYAGPISSRATSDLPQELIIHFQQKFIEYCTDHSIISVFSRLHPLIDQTSFFHGFGHLLSLNKTVSIDLTVPSDDQRRVYRKSLKSELNQLRRFGFTVEAAKDNQELESFIDIYHSTMDKLGASDNYYFSREYFYTFLENKDFECKLLVAKFEGEIVAGAIFTIVNGIMQYHLAGTSSELVHKAPMKLILDEARLMANSLNLKYLHLGGGVGGEDNDSLFRFKSGFSKNFYQFAVWKMVVDPLKYNEMVKNMELENSKSNFFPLYRLSQV